MAESLPNVFLAFRTGATIKELPTVATVRAQLATHGLNAERAADIPDSTAFQRAAAEMKTKEIDVKVFTSKETDRPRAQFDALTEDGGRLKRSFIGQYELSEEGEVSTTAGAPPVDFPDAFRRAQTTYVGADIGKVIQEILAKDALGAYTPRKGGAIYFVPVKPEAADLLERVKSFAESIGDGFRCYSVPDTAADRADIADAIATHFLDQIGAHAEAIAAYNEDTRGGIIENRRASIQQTYESMGKLRHIMNGRFITCQDEMRRLLARMAELDAARTAQAERQAVAEQEAAETARHEGRRQIVSV
jgi:hypothetical protein